MKNRNILKGATAARGSTAGAGKVRRINPDLLNSSGPAIISSSNLKVRPTFQMDASSRFGSERSGSPMRDNRGSSNLNQLNLKVKEMLSNRKNEARSRDASSSM